MIELDTEGQECDTMTLATGARRPKEHAAGQQAESRLEAFSSFLRQRQLIQNQELWLQSTVPALCSGLMNELDNEFILRTFLRATPFSQVEPTSIIYTD